jgi:hypothetical protein
MYHNPRLHAIKLLRQYFYEQNIDKAQQALILVKEGQTCPIASQIGNAPQDKFMVLKILTSKQILAVLEEVIDEHRINDNRHAGKLPRRPARITKVEHRKGNPISKAASSSDPLG